MIYCGQSGLKWGVRWGQCQEFDDSGCSNTSLTFEFKLTSHFDERAIQSKEPTCGKTSSVPRIIWSVAMLLSCLVSSSRHLCTPQWRPQNAWQGSQGGEFGSEQKTQLCFHTCILLLTPSWGGHCGLLKTEELHFWPPASYQMKSNQGISEVAELTSSIIGHY